MKSYRVRNPIATGPDNFSSAGALINTGIDLFFQTEEMVNPSAQVIGHRTARIVMTGLAPSQCDRKEFNLMRKTFIESVHAMAIHLTSTHQKAAHLVIQQMLNSTVSLISVASSSSLHQSGQGLGKLARDTMLNSTEAVSQLNTSLADIARTGSQPIHARATAHAMRLKDALH